MVKAIDNLCFQDCKETKNLIQDEKTVLSNLSAGEEKKTILY